MVVSSKRPTMAVIQRVLVLNQRLMMGEEREWDFKKDCRKGDGWETLQKRKAQMNITGKRRVMIRQEL